MSKITDLLKDTFKPNVKGRMIRSVIANIYDKGAVLLVQLLTIPILSHYWGVDGYGLWLMLMTAPTYIALSDMGLGTAAGVKLTEYATKKNFSSALEVLHSTIAVVLGTVSIVIFGIIAYAFWYGQHGAIFAGFKADEIALAIVLIAIYALILTQMNILNVVWRATEKYAFAMFYSGTLIIAEGLIVVTMATCGKNIVYAALGLLCIRAIGYLIFVYLLKKYESWVSISITQAKKVVMRSLLAPSMAALGLTLAIALSVQGAVLVVGATLGAAAVAVFGATRTIVRAPLQLAGLVLRPSIPELTRAFVNKDIALVKKINKVNLKVTLWVMLPFSIILLLVGDKIISIISAGKIEAPFFLILFLVLGTIFHAVWNALGALWISLNKQILFSYRYLFVVFLTILIVYFFNLPNISLISFLFVLPEFFIALYLILNVNKLDKLIDQR